MTDMRSIRTELGLTQEELADRLALHQTTISRMETGSMAIDRRTSLALNSLLLSHRSAVSADGGGNAAPQHDASSGKAGEVSAAAGAA